MILIINADDFGLDDRANAAVVKCFRDGLCSSTTLMPVASGFNEACQLAHENDLLAHVGMHLVLREAYPLTEKIRYFPKFCDPEGRLCFSATSNVFHMVFRFNREEGRALAGEIRAQIGKCREQGIPLTHIDSHHNIHSEWGIASILIEVARQEKIPYIRIMPNCDPYVPLRARIYFDFLNRRLKAASLARTGYFGNLSSLVSLEKRAGPADSMGSFEAMIHPAWDDRGTVVNVENGVIDAGFAGVIKKLYAYADMVSYSGTRYLRVR